MVLQKTGLILERHNSILDYNGHTNQTKDLIRTDKVLFEAFITVDERYFVMNDHVIDIQEQTNLGYLWDSLDVFKKIFGNVQVDDSEYREIQEGISSLPLLENKSDLYLIRDILIEGFWSSVGDGLADFGNWAKDKVVAAGKGIANFASSAWNNIKKFGIAISELDFKKVLSMIGKGVLWVLRKFKDAAYSTVGIIVDAILVATGIGKVAQAVFWGLVTGLDVYQMASGDWEPKGTPTWEKWLDLVCDIIGLLGAGVAAKGARGLVKGIKSATQIPKFVKKNKAIMNIITKLKNGASWVISKITSVLKGLKGKWKPLDKFIDKILSFCKKIFTGLKNFVKKIFPDPVKLTGKQKLKRGAKAGGIAVGLTYGIEKGVEAYTGVSIKDTEAMGKTMQTYDEIYGDTDPFDNW
jgi:hypothetical protein